MKRTITDFLVISMMATTLWLSADHVTAQAPAPLVAERIAVITRSSADSITLRWAPLNAQAWQSGNVNGYRVERYVLVRNGSLLPVPEKVILDASVKPFPEHQWENLVQRDRYAPIAAQALFGDRFEVNLKQPDIFTIANKARENGQRFALALFSADMSPLTARASGLWFTDKHVRAGEQYLYRIVVNGADSLRGSVFTGPGQVYLLQKPGNFRGEFKDGIVTLRWDKSSSNHYTAYIVERSDDGKHFVAVSDTPIATISPGITEDARHEYAIDSLEDASRVHHYRVRGITPFGEIGPPSNTVSGKGTASVSQVPYISSGENIENKKLVIRWTFPIADNGAIKGFSVERSANPAGAFTPITQQLLSPAMRHFEDQFPQQVNYYTVTAHGLDGTRYTSHAYFAQLVDSLPPAPPQGLRASALEDGRISLSWTANDEPDIYGYRIYRAYHQSEEMAQLTSGPVTSTEFSDSIDLKTLNETIYYSVMAIDVHQNHSALSTPLRVLLPDKVPPQAPVFLPARGTEDGIALHWIRGGSPDIVQYKLFRKSAENPQWKQIKVIDAASDTGLYYLDRSAPAGQIIYYTALSVDDTGLESQPAHAIPASRPNNVLHPPIRWKKPVINGEQSQVTLAWDYNHSGVEAFRIFKAVDDQRPTLFRTIDAGQKQFTDAMMPGQSYTYRIMALFVNGNKSALSEELKIHY